MHISYSPMMKIMHWLVGLLMIGVLIVGFLMANILPDSIRYDFYDWHKAFGLTVFGLGIVRIIVRHMSTVPPMDPSVRPYERILANAVYACFYVLMIAFPLSGYVMSAAGGHPISFFGIDVPLLIAKNPMIGGIAHEMHEIFGYLLAGLITIHVSGVVVHKIRDGVNILKRML